MARTKLSVNSSRVSWARVAPSAVRTASSRCRAAAREREMPARLTQPTRSTAPAAQKIVTNTDLMFITISSVSGTNVKPIFPV